MADGEYSIIQGTLERITYVNEENQYVVGRLQVPGRRDLATIVGNLPAVTPGETLRLHGRLPCGRSDPPPRCPRRSSRPSRSWPRPSPPKNPSR